MKKSHIIAITLMTVAVAGFVLLVLFHSSLQLALSDDAYKLILQFTLITVVGGFVSWVFSELKRESDLREARRQSLRSFYSTALAAYNRAKKLRRLMTVFVPYQAGATEYVNKDEYRKLMTELEEVQLEFEGIRRQVHITEDLFRKEQGVEELLIRMQAYLRKVLKEFDKQPGLFSKGELELSALEKFKAFIDDTYNDETKPEFVREFSDSYDQVETALLRLILQ